MVMECELFGGFLLLVVGLFHIFEFGQIVFSDVSFCKPCKLWFWRQAEQVTCHLLLHSKRESSPRASTPAYLPRKAKITQPAMTVK